MHVNLIRRLWNVQKVCYTLMQSYTLWTSCLFGLFSDDWLWCFSTLLTAGNCSNGTCFSYDKDPESSSNMCLPIISAVQKKKKIKKPDHSPSKWIAHWLSEPGCSTTRTGPGWPLEAIWDNKSSDPQFRNALGKVRMANFPLPQYQMLR